MKDEISEDEFFADDILGDLEEFGVELLSDKTGFGFMTSGTLGCFGCPTLTVSSAGTMSTRG